jgi:hypothetical protein
MQPVGRVDFADIAFARLKLNPGLRPGQSLSLSIVGRMYMALDRPVPPKEKRMWLRIVDYTQLYSSFVLIDDAGNSFPRETEREAFYLGRSYKEFEPIFQIDCTIAWEQASGRVMCHGLATYSYVGNIVSAFQCHGASDNQLKDVSEFQFGFKDRWMAGRAVAHLLDA